MTETTMHALPEILDDGPLAGFGKDLNRFLATEQRRPWRPVIDFFEDGEELILQAELAGVPRNDVDIHVERDKLEIRGRRERRRPDSPRSLDAIEFHRERRHGSFRRLIELPMPVDTERFAAELDRGLLTITLKKAKKGDNH